MAPRSAPIAGLAVCPVRAIFTDSEVPEQWKAYIEMTADHYRLSREQFAEKWGREP